MKHNVYANGFQNIEYSSGDIAMAVGVVEPGEYQFTTEREEHVRCITGKLTINGVTLLPGETHVTGPKESFTISTEEPSSYLCVYN